MDHPLAVALVVSSVPVILALCRSLGPDRAAPYAILGTFLILARTNPDDKFFGVTIDKLTIGGLSLLLGAILFDRRTLARARLHWVDVPMLLYVAAPAIGLLFGRSSDARGSLDQSWLTFAEWGVPYAAGRLYFADRDGPRRLSIGVTVAALLCVPFCAFEMVMGKGWFIRSLILGLTTEGEYRLGGWRPTLMMSNGLELVSWMALASVLATWLWACRERWRAKYLPAWLPPLALIVTTIACRGIYGYLILVLGLSAIGLLLLTRQKWALLPLLLLPVAYIGLRVAGAWDGRGFVRLAEAFGSREASSVGLRLAMEDGFIRESWEHGIVFGLGGRYADSWADGWWLTLLKRGGLLAVASHYAAFLLPPALFLSRRSSGPVAATSAAGMALFIILHMIDSLHNTPLIAVSTLLGGSLAGSFLAEAGRNGGEEEGRSRASTPNPGHATYRLGDIGTPRPSRGEVEVLGPVGFMLATACLFYVFDHAKVDGQEWARLIGGFGSDFLFAAAGALAAASPRRSLARVAAFGLTFALLAITSNLANHPSSRPVWMANVLQGMALSGVVVACCRRAIGGGPLPFAVLAAVSAAWWAVRESAPVFPGSQYLYAAGDIYLALFPTVPWLTLAALGAVLVGSSANLRAVLAVALGLAGLLSWGLGSPLGAPTKFPLNPTHALIGGSLASAVFWLEGPARRWKPIASVSSWLGDRWLVFFYVHLGFMNVLFRLGLTSPIACWAALIVLSVAATWLVSEAFGRARLPFRHPATWALIIASTFAAGLLPGVPSPLVAAAGGVLGLAFASRYDDLAALMLGPTIVEHRSSRPSVSSEEMPRYLARLALVIAILVAPELLASLPAPLGAGARPSALPTAVDEPAGTTAGGRPAVDAPSGPKSAP